VFKVQRFSVPGSEVQRSRFRGSEVHGSEVKTGFTVIIEAAYAFASGLQPDSMDILILNIRLFIPPEVD